jgi:putative inorganic carbon (hco3(-)) transporter
MAIPVAWRPPWYAWAVLGAAGLAFVHETQPTRLEGHWQLLTPVAIAIGVLVLRRLWEMPPAVTMCAAIASTAFSGGWAQMGLAGMPVNRLLVLVVLLQLLLRAPGTAATPPLRIGNVHLLMFATVLYALASAAIVGTLGDELSILQLVDVFGITPFVLFLVAPAVFASERERKMLLATLVGLGAYLGAMAIFESLGPHALVFPSYIRQLNPELVAGAKASGPFQSPTAEGFACFACAVAAVIALGAWRRAPARWLAALVAILCLFGCFLTLERGVWIATVAAISVTALATRAGRRWLLPGTAAAALLVATALALSPTLAHRTATRATYQQSLWDRRNQTSTGLRMVAARPLFGFGLDRYESDSLDYFRQPSTYPMTGYHHGVTIGLPDPILPIHNTYLSYAVELGLVGVALWLASIVWAIGGAIFAPGPISLRPWKLGLLAIFVLFLVISCVDPHTAPFPAVLLFVWAGVARG